MKKQPFAAILTRLRKEAGWSVYRLAKESSITAGYIHDLENGTKQPSLDIARKLATALGVSLSVWD